MAQFVKYMTKNSLKKFREPTELAMRKPMRFFLILIISAISQLMHTAAFATNDIPSNAKCTLNVNQFWGSGAISYSMKKEPITLSNTPVFFSGSDSRWKILENKNISNSPNLNNFRVSLTKQNIDDNHTYLVVSLLFVKRDFINNVHATIRFRIPPQGGKIDIFMHHGFGPLRLATGLPMMMIDDFSDPFDVSSNNPSLLLVGSCKIAPLTT